MGVRLFPAVHGHIADSVRGRTSGLPNLCRSKIGFWLWPAPSLSSGGSLVLVDQAAQDRFSADLVGVEVRCDDAWSVVFSAGDALVDALMWPGGVVMLLVFGQDGAQVCFAQDQG